MRIIGFSTVKNEADIIESFVRFNLPFLDELVVVDNGSSDTTPEILRRLGEELPRLRVQSDPSYTDHRQEAKLTELIAAYADEGDMDFALAIDADEFLLCSGRAVLERGLECLPALTCGTWPWVTYVPCARDDRAQRDVLRRIRHRRTAEPKTRLKVAIPAAVASLPGFRLGPGSHRVHAAGAELPGERVEGVALAHVPLRSPEQMTTKVLLGDWALSSKLGRRLDEGAHWHRFALKVPETGVMTEADFFIAANQYPDGATDLVEDPIAGPGDSELRYPELAVVDVVRRMAAFGNRYFGDAARTPFSNGYMSIGRTRYGLLAYLRSDTVIGRSVKWYGEWAEEEIRLLQPLLRPGDCAVDIGANIGTHAVPFAKAVGASGRVYAFEPQRLLFQVLCANAPLNRLDNVFAMWAAVGAQRGTARIKPIDTVRGANFGRSRLEEAAAGEEVRVEALDDLDLPGVRLIKIDVEGMEREVLLGAQRLIARDRPFLFVENNTKEHSQALLSQIAGYGYRIYWHFAPYFNPANFFGTTTDIFAAVGRPEINVLAVPDEAGYAPERLEHVRDPKESWEDAYRRSRAASGG